METTPRLLGGEIYSDYESALQGHFVFSRPEDDCYNYTVNRSRNPSAKYVVVSTKIIHNDLERPFWGPVTFNCILQAYGAC